MNMIHKRESSVLIKFYLTSLLYYSYSRWVGRPKENCWDNWSTFYRHWTPFLSSIKSVKAWKETVNMMSKSVPSGDKVNY